VWGEVSKGLVGTDGHVLRIATFLPRSVCSVEEVVLVSLVSDLGEN